MALLRKDFDDFYWDRSGSSLLPYSFRDQYRWFDDYGFGLSRDFLRDFRVLERRLHREVNPWLPTGNDGDYQLYLDVDHFNPHEITVRTIDSAVVVEGKHQERRGKELVSCHFTRRYALPPGYDSTNVTSELSSDGVLTIKAKPLKPWQVKERVVNIQRTYVPARLNVN